MAEKDTLSEREMRFCREYLIDMNGKAAAVRAGYSEKSAESRACKILQRERVQLYLAKLGRPLANKLDLTAERVLEEIARIAFSNPQALYDEEGNIKPVQEWPAEAAAAVAAFETTTNEKGETVKRVRVFDKLKALELAGRYLKLFGAEEGERVLTVVFRDYRGKDSRDEKVIEHGSH